MTVERLTRCISGFLIFFSLFMSYKTTVWWLSLLIFVGFDLLQSGFTNRSIISGILRLFGMIKGLSKSARSDIRRYKR